MDTLFNQLASNDAALFYNPDFKDFIEMNLADLRRASVENSPIFELTEAQRARADRNFNLLCNMANVPYHLHWLTLRINNLYCFSDYRPSNVELYKVDTNKLAELRLKFIESQNIS